MYNYNLNKMNSLITKLAIFVTVIAFFSSCSSYTVSVFQPDQNNGSNCPNPIYIGTMSKSAKVIAKNSDGSSYIGFDQSTMTLVSLLDDARKKYGEDITIHNIRWDIKNGKKKIGVIYDVILCK
jgi:hypothetical protein